MARRLHNIAGFKVNKERCHTCPFNEHGDRDTRHEVEGRCFKGSQMCHGTDNKTLCRGSRDHQLQIFYRMGIIKEPTDACWEKRQKELK